MRRGTWTWIACALLAAAIMLPACGVSRPPAPTAAAPNPTATPRLSTPTAAAAPTSAASNFPWWNRAVFYEVFVRSFFDSNGDGIGDLNGLTAKLDYLNDGAPPGKGKSLGVTGLWLMPVFPSPSYHGYDVINFRGVNPDLGSLQDMKKLLAEAHRRGMRVILDLPLNHTSNRNPWFAAAGDPQSQYHDWYIFSDNDPGYSGPFNEQVWHVLQGGGFYYGIFSPEMPDLNYGNPAVTRQMEDIARFWLKDVGVDGFRLDAAPYLIEEGQKQVSTAPTHQWYQQFRAFYKGINPEALTVGEVWRPSAEAATYTKGDQLDLDFDFYLSDVILQGVRNQVAANILTNLEAEIKYFRPGQFATFLTNHDMDRVMTGLAGDAAKAKAAAAILLTSPGVPFLYYGEEIGMSGKQTPDSALNPDVGRRTPMQWNAGPQAGFTLGEPWAPVNPDYPQINVEAELADPNSLLSFYRQLIQLRGAHSALQVGDFYRLEADNRALFVSMRAAGDEIILVILNLSDQPVSNSHLALSKGPLKGNYQPEALVGNGQAAPLKASSQGGFSGYQPQPEIPAHANFIYRLKPMP